MMRLSLGPVFACEWLTTARSWRIYAMRVVFGLGLLAILGAIAIDAPFRNQTSVSIQQQAEIARAFSIGIISTEIVLMLLIAPASTASTLCLDKARGTLAHILTTDLTSGEIIFGKLAARLLPALGLVMSSLGVMAITTLMGGVDPASLLGAILVTLGVTVLGASLSLVISVWAAKTHEVVMASYLVLIAWIGLYPFWYLMSFMGLGVPRPPAWLELAHPFWLALNNRPGQVPIHHHAMFLVACVAISAGMTGLATARLRKVAIQQMNRPAGSRGKRRWWTRANGEARAPKAHGWLRVWSGPSLDGNPVLWREWHRRRPSRWTRGIWLAYTTASIGLMALGLTIIASDATRLPALEIVMIPINGFQVAIGLLLVSVSAATVLAEERVRGSLDVLLTTSISTRAIVWGKWLGAFRVVPWLALPPAVLTLAAAYCVTPISIAGQPIRDADWTRWIAVPLMIGLTLSSGAVIVSVGLVMATWISRLDRAVMATVSFYLAVCLLWPIAMAFLLPHEEIHGPGLACGSPVMAIAYTGSAMVEVFRWDAHGRWLPQIGWATFWILANTAFAAILLKLELSRFNRKLGRTPDRGMPARPAPRPAAKPKAEPLMV